MKENVKSVVVLTAICLVVAVLLAVTNFYTAPIIAENKAAASLGSLAEVMPGATGFEEMELPADAPATVKNLYKETSGMGYVMVLETTSQYSAGPMGITVGFGADNKICGTTLTSYQESKDFGADYPATYIGADSALGGIDTVAGVTYSSTAFKNAITDAFNTLINSGLLAEGQKSEEQLIEEVMPLALPGCADTLGKAQVVEGAAIDGITKVYDAANGVGHIFVMDNAGATVVAGVNAFGEVQVFDLEGNDITASAADVVAKASAVPSIASEKLEANTTLIQNTFEGATVTPVEATGKFDTLTAAFTVDGADGRQYAFISMYFGFQENMKIVVVLNENGEVVLVKSTSELIQEKDYYPANPLTNESAYKEGLLGRTETDDSVIVSGATISTTAVRKALDSAFAALQTVKEAA